MSTLSELDLEYLPMESEELAAEPLPYFDAVRKKHPWLASCAFGFVVHDYEAIKDLLWMEGQMLPCFDDTVELLGAQDLEWGRMAKVQLLNLSGDDHKRIRNSVAHLFTPAAANRNRQLMRDTITRLLDEWVPKGAFDFEEFVSYFPVSVMSVIIGASTGEIPRLRGSLEALGLAMGMNPEFMPQVEQGQLTLDAFVRQLVADRRAGNRLREHTDLLDTLLSAANEGGLSDREIFDLLIFAYVGGYDTSKNVLTLIMHTLLDYPEIYKRCAEDFSYCSKVIEEGLRYHSPATSFRKAAEDFVYRDVLIPKGTILFFPLSVAGRDPKAFPDTNNFNPERKHENRHMAFGRGPHLCLGQFIARAQMEEGLHLIAQRIKNPRLAGEIGWRPFYGVWGIRGLPIEFEPAH